MARNAARKTLSAQSPKLVLLKKPELAQESWRGAFEGLLDIILGWRESELEDRVDDWRGHIQEEIQILFAAGASDEAVRVKLDKLLNLCW